MPFGKKSRKRHWVTIGGHLRPEQGEDEVVLGKYVRAAGPQVHLLFKGCSR